MLSPIAVEVIVVIRPLVVTIVVAIEVVIAREAAPGDLVGSALAAWLAAGLNDGSVRCARYPERESPAAFDSTTALTYAALHVAVVVASRRARARVGSRAGARRLRDVRPRRRPLVGVWRRRAGGRGDDARSASSRAFLGVHLLLRRGRTRRVDRMVDARRWRRRRDPVAADTAGAPHVAAAADAC